MAENPLERQRRLVATLPQTRGQFAFLAPCAALGKCSGAVKCGHCGQTVTPGKRGCGMHEAMKAAIEAARTHGAKEDQRG